MATTSSARPFAVVTGASSGIGYYLAKEFAENGYDLLVVAEDAGINTAAKDFAAAGVQAEAAQIDLASYEGVEAFYARIKAAGRPVDAIALNAGVGVGGGDFTETDLEKELNLINLNVTSTVHLAKRVIPDMKARGEGKILFTSSVASAAPGPFESVYSASKAFIQHMSIALREELKPYGVSVTALLPGPTETNFFKRAGMENTKVGQAKKDSAADVAKDGFKALMKGNDQVVAGSAMNLLQTNLGMHLPDTIRAKMHKGQTQPLSGSEQAKAS